MAITVADNFSYQGKKPLDGRDTFATLAAMKAYAEASVYDGCLSYCDEDGKRYEFKSTNTVDPTTGKWREYSSGGGGETYSDFTGATASTAGAHGLVPAPSAGDEGKVLFGNGAWGALPSVDLSVLSNEAFIFSATEKPVGMAKNRKLIYAQTLSVTTPNAESGTMGTVPTTIEELIWVNGHYNNSTDAQITFNPSYGSMNVWHFLNSATLNVEGLQTWARNRSATITIFYTKTTDSPLPSDVKFAGVTSNGEVILEKTVTGLSLTLQPNTWTSSTISNSGIKAIRGIKTLSTNGDCWTCVSAAVGDSGYVVLNNTRGYAFTINEIVLQYTLAS